MEGGKGFESDLMWDALGVCLFEQVKFTKSSKGSAPSGHGHPKVAGHVGQAVQVIVVALRV